MSSKRYVLILPLLLAVAGMVQAADLPRRDRVVVAPPPVAGPLWEGWHVGAHLGLLWGEPETTVGFQADCTCRPEGVTAILPGPDGNLSALFGGVQGGYDWQRDAFVLGLEADVSLVGGSLSRSYRLPAATLVGAGLGAITDPDDGFIGNFRTEIDWMATVRARAGIAAGNWLFYATGGVAFADVERRLTFNALIAPPPTIVATSSKDDAVEVGWTIGAGIEGFLSKNVTAKVEYAYTDLGSRTRQHGYYLYDPANIQQSVFTREELRFHTVKLGLNWHFDR